MKRQLVIEWQAGRTVTGVLEAHPGPTGPSILLAPGAGAGQSHPFMAGLRERLAAAGHPTLTFDYPYMAGGRRAPDRLPVLLDCHRAALLRLQRRGLPVVLAGKSMGGRVASHLAAEHPGAVALVCYGYPLVSPSTGEERSTAHLAGMGIPVLFVSGSRDRLAPLPLLRRVAAGTAGADLEVIEGGDHGFRVPASAGLDPGAVLDSLAERTLEWIAGAVGSGASGRARGRGGSGLKSD